MRRPPRRTGAQRLTIAWASLSRNAPQVNLQSPLGPGNRAISLQLTPQEQQVASLVSRGHSNADVAAQLFLSRRTVEFHLSNAYQKLGVRSRGDLVRLDLS